MFEQRGWSRTGVMVGPVPLTPSSCVAADVLVWADRAPVNGAWLDAVAAIDPSSLTGGDRIGLVRAWERLRRGMDAGFTTAVGAVAARPCKPEPGDPSCAGGRDCPHDWSREDTSLALNIGRETARYLLDQSRELVARLPGLLGELAGGQASFAHVRKAAARTMGLSDAQAAEVAEQLAGRAGSKTPGSFDRLAAAAVDRVRDPEEVLAAHAAARRARTGITPMAPLEDGLAGAVLIGPAEKIAALFGWARGFTLTNKQPEDTRTVGERRLDALLTGILHPRSTPVAADRTTGPEAGASAGNSHSSPAPGKPGGAGVKPGNAGGNGSGPVAPDRELPRERVALRLVLGAPHAARA